MTNPKKSKGEVFIDFIQNTTKNYVEFYVEGSGWLIYLRENIEIVSDNWFSSTKFVASKHNLLNENPDVIFFENLYRINASFIENENNVKYNLHFNTLNVFADKITAFH